MTQSLISREKHIERIQSAPKKLTVRESVPSFFLNGAHERVRQVATNLSRHILVEKNAL